MSHNTASIKVHFSSLVIELLTHKPTASFQKIYKNQPNNRVSNPVKNFTM